MLFEVEGVDAVRRGRVDRPRRCGSAARSSSPPGTSGDASSRRAIPDTAKRDFDTLGVLASYRGDIETTEPLPLGIVGDVVSPGRVRVGDPVIPAA